MRRRAAIPPTAAADGPGAWTAEEIADHLGATRIAARRVRRQLAAEGPGATPTGTGWVRSRG